MADQSRDDEIIKRAKKRFEKCQDWESNFRTLFVDDIKFCNADSDNKWQWDSSLYQSRAGEDRPCLTLNKTRQHVLQITNDAKQNTPGIVVHAVKDGASYKAAEIIEGVIRHIEYASNAQNIYDSATDFQVQGGMGFWRVITEYADDESFDQEIFIKRIKNQLSVYIDKDAKEVDKSDAKYGFIYDDLPKDEFKRKYPKHADIGNDTGLGENDSWVEEDYIRVAEYYECEYENKTLVLLPDENGVPKMQYLNDLPEEIREQVKNDENIRRRTVQKPKWMWYLIAGNRIIDRKEWAGKYLPIVMIVGEEMVIDGQLERKGHVRALKDPQRQYNYWASSSVEFVALQGKQPYIAPVNAIAGFEDYWANANTKNFAYLPYNDTDEQGSPVAKPERQQPPVMAQAYVAGMQNAAQEMEMVSGQYEASFGQPSNETSGVAIDARQRRGDRATYHYIDNLAIGIRYTGKILIDLIPKIYDTKRILRIIKEDGEDETVILDPEAKQAVQEQQNIGDNDINFIFNPNVGVYDVVSEVGASYQTQRQATFAAISQICAQNPAMMDIVGDLLFKAADFPLSDELSERYKRKIDPALLGKAPSPKEQQLTVQLQQMQQVIVNMQKDLDKRDADVAIDEYKAETDRIKVVGKEMTVEEMQPIIEMTIRQLMTTQFPVNEQQNIQQQIPQGANQNA